jgi:hypothetical protein
MRNTCCTRKGERRQVGIIDYTRIRKGIEEQQTCDVQTVLGFSLDLRLLMLLDLCLQDILLLLESLNLRLK